MAGEFYGAVSYQLSTEQQKTVDNNVLMCLAWYKQELPFVSSYRSFYNSMLDCPCSLTLVRFDRRFVWTEFTTSTLTYTQLRFSRYTKVNYFLFLLSVDKKGTSNSICAEFRAVLLLCNMYILHSFTIVKADSMVLELFIVFWLYANQVSVCVKDVYFHCLFRHVCITGLREDWSGRVDMLDLSSPTMLSSILETTSCKTSTTGASAVTWLAAAIYSMLLDPHRSTALLSLRLDLVNKFVSC